MNEVSLAGKVGKRQADRALALIGGVIDGDDVTLPFGALPDEDHEAIVGPVAFPARRALERQPLAIAKSRLAQQFEKAIIKVVH